MTDTQAPERWEDTGTVTSVRMGYTQDGKPQICIAFQLENPAPQTPNAAPWYGFFTEKGLPLVERALSALGWDLRENLGKISEIVETALLVGRKAPVTVAYKIDHQTGECAVSDQGTYFTRVEFVGSNASFLTKPMEHVELAQFEQFLGRALGLNTHAAPAAPVRQAPVAPPTPARQAPAPRPQAPPARTFPSARPVPRDSTDAPSLPIDYTDIPF